MNGKEFYKSKGKRCPSNLKELYDAGYFGNATYDETKRVYNIHRNTPVPYSADKRVSRVDKLSLKLLDIKTPRLIQFNDSSAGFAA